MEIKTLTKEQAKILAEQGGGYGDAADRPNARAVRDQEDGLVAAE